METLQIKLEKTPENENQNKKKEDSEQAIIESILSGCSDLMPLKFVDTIEKFYHTIINKTRPISLQTLSSYKKTHTREFHMIDLEYQNKISSKISRNINDINCVKVNGNILFTGEKDGKVYMYEIEKGIQTNEYSIEENKSPVSVIENKGIEYLLVGYEDGTINLFDIKSKNLIKSIKDIHKTKILTLKFISIEKNAFQVISSDEEGQVMFINSSNTLLNKKTIGTPIYKEEEPTFAIAKFKPYEDKKLSFLVFALINKVYVYKLEPKLLQLFEIKKPKYADKNDIPDISLGWGVPPISEEATKKKISHKNREKEVLLAVGWGNIISLYDILNKGVKFGHEVPIGFFQNNNAIIRLGFFSSSIIYFLDKSLQIKAINTAFFNYGKFDDNIIYENKNALLDQGEKFNKIKFNNILKTNEIEYNYYRNFIYNMKKCIYIFTKEGLRMGKILNYKEFIDRLIKNGNNWNSAMCLAIDIYKGNYNNFINIPLDEDERKKDLHPYLVELLNKYIDYNFKILHDKSPDKDIIDLSTDDNTTEINDEKIIECINVSIEFCIEINSVDYLIKDVEKTFTEYGKGDLFYKLFESFIFNDLLIKEDIDPAALTSLYAAYKMKNELVLLSHLFTHLNLNNLNNFAIKKLAVQENLFSLIIFIFSNGDCGEDFFLPISKLFKGYSEKVKKENIEKEKHEDEKNKQSYFSYYDLYVKKGIKGINKMENCKEYIGHKLLWYIEMSLKGNKFASGTEGELLKFQSNSENYKKFVCYIYFWILQETIFNNLLQFDSYSLFSVLSLFFTEPKIIKIIQNFDFSKINADLIEQLIDEQMKNTYLMRSMNSINKVLTMVKDEKKSDNKIKDPLKSSLTIMPAKNNNDIKIKEKLEKINEEGNEKEKDEKKEASLETPKEESKEKESPKEENKEKEAPKDKKEKGKVEEKQKEEKLDPFASSKGATKFGKGVKLNDLNSVLEYIIKIVESQPSDLSRIDLDTFLIQYTADSCEKIHQRIRGKILGAFENMLFFFSENKKMRKDIIAQNLDKFNIHNLSKKVLDPQDPYSIHISKILLKLLNSKTNQFTKDELYNLKTAASGTKFTKVKVKIDELSLRYKECLEIYIKEENPKLREDVFNWIEDKFQYFIEEINEEKKQNNEKEDKFNESRTKLLIQNYKSFRDAIIDKAFDLAKMKLDKTKKMVGKYLSNSEKLKIYQKMESDSKIQFEFLEQLLYQHLEQLIEEGNIPENITDTQRQEDNIDLLDLYIKNKKEKIKDEKKVREEFDKLLLDQIHLLKVLNKRSDILNYLKKNIKYYPNYPMREALKECVESDITESAVFLYQTLGENRSALNYSKEILKKSFVKYLTEDITNKDFLGKLDFCINICKENSDALMKKLSFEKNRKGDYNEGEELWFELLEILYIFEEDLEKKEIDGEKKKSIQITLQKAIEDLLKEMCLYVTIQNLVKHVTEKQDRAQYKEFKSILEKMLRSNTSFDRVLNSVIVILKDSIEESESKRKKITSKGNNYNFQKCDVCKKYFENSSDEVIYCFGCGHQSHEKCCYKKKLINENENVNKIILNEKEEEGNFRLECEVCRKNRIEKRNKWEENEVNFSNVQEIIEEDANENKIEEPSPKMKSFKFGNRTEKFRKIDKYDQKYDNEVSMFY